MGMFRWVFGLRTDQDLCDVARKVAAESQTMVWQLLLPRVGQIRSTPEAWAYVRVRVRRAVRQQMYRVIDRSDWSAVGREEVILDHALSLLAGQYANRLVAPMSAAASVRRAA